MEAGERPLKERDDWASHWNSYAKSASENPAQEMMHRLVLSALGELPGRIGLLLDVGSGQGDFLRKAVSKNIADRYVGFELSDSGVAISRGKVPEARFVVADIFQPPPETADYVGQADTVVCSEVLEHVDDERDFLVRMGGYLKEGGTLVLTVPGGPLSAFDRHIGHRRHYDRKRVIGLLEESGFEVVAVRRAGFPFFNLYRLTVILRGEKLIQDVHVDSGGGGVSSLAVLVMKVFRVLFTLNCTSSPLGWQIVATARKKW